ncbi:MAG: rolling circle replication-associated protein [Methylophilus sp.]|uniref:rolling circle replication-associated protein n=1 Tax=Methylophilus sp. TaxID=29541 RepID=UPI0040361E5F
MELSIDQSFDHINDAALDVRGNTGIEKPFEYRLKTRTFLNNTVEFVMSRIKHRIPKLHSDPIYGEMTSYTKTLTDEERAAKDAENLSRAVRRAKQAVYFSVMQISADHLLTLTTRENIQDREKFFTVFTKFIRLVRTKILVDGRLVSTPRRPFHYVAVPELQDRGAYHMHCAVAGFQDVKLLRACWYVALGGSVGDSSDTALGAINVRYKQRRLGGQSETFKTFQLVGYLTKYIDKDFAADKALRLHRYRKSKDVPKPIEFDQVLMACNYHGNDFLDAIIEVNSIAAFVTGQNTAGMIQWNRGQDVYVLRSVFHEELED